jgi:hypothetical protein
MIAAKDTRGVKEQTERPECSSRKSKRLARRSFHAHGCSPVAFSVPVILWRKDITKQFRGNIKTNYKYFK